MMGPASPSEKNGSSSGGKSGKKGRKSKDRDHHTSSTSAAVTAAEIATERAKNALLGVQDTLKAGVKKLEEQDHPAAHLIDTMCGPYFDGGGTHGGSGKKGGKRGKRDSTRATSSFYSEDYNSDDMDGDDSRGTLSEDDEHTLDTDYNASTVNGSTVASTTGPSGENPKKSSKKDSMDSSYLSQSEYESDDGKENHNKKGRSKRDKHHHSSSRGDRHHRSRPPHSGVDDPSSMASYDDEEGPFDDDSKTMDTTTSGTANTSPSKAAAAAANAASTPSLLSKPLASSFAKRCYFTKAGIGKTTQHYEGLTLTGNVVLMLAAAMKLKGCPTICDEDLRRVEQTYPNQFSRLPDELLLSSGWRRISKYCHFSNKPIPDGIPFFRTYTTMSIYRVSLNRIESNRTHHSTMLSALTIDSKQRLHPQGGYYFLLAAAVGMVRPIDVEPLTRGTLVLLETDYPTQCDSAPEVLIQDPDEWTLVNKFCFFSGGPINTDEDVYYQADFDGNPIFMLAFLSPSLTPEELYKLDITAGDEEHPFGLTSVTAVQEVETVYDLTDRDFHDLKLYHLGPCRAL